MVWGSHFPLGMAYFQGLTRPLSLVNSPDPSAKVWENPSATQSLASWKIGCLKQCDSLSWLTFLSIGNRMVFFISRSWFWISTMLLFSRMAITAWLLCSTLDFEPFKNVIRVLTTTCCDCHSSLGLCIELTPFQQKLGFEYIIFPQKIPSSSPIDTTC